MEKNKYIIEYYGIDDNRGIGSVEGVGYVDPYGDVLCSGCGKGEDDDLILLCDAANCNKAYHTYCLNPKLDVIPEGEWYCPQHISHYKVIIHNQSL